MDYKENTQQGRLTGRGTSKYMQLDTKMDDFRDKSI